MACVGADKVDLPSSHYTSQKMQKPRRTLQTMQRTRDKLTNFRRMLMAHERHSLPNIYFAPRLSCRPEFKNGVTLHTYEPEAEKLE